MQGTRADDALDEDAAYLELLEKQRQALAGTGDGQSSPLILDDWTDDEETDTALDRHDPYALLVHSMNALQSSHPAQFQVQMPIMVMRMGPCPACCQRQRSCDLVTRCACGLRIVLCRGSCRAWTQRTRRLCKR